MMRELVGAAGVMVLASAVFAGGEMSFSYANFNGTPPLLVRNGSAVATGGTLRLTAASSGQTGTAWRANKVSVGGGFMTTFRCRLPMVTGGSFGPGDGMALVFQQEGTGYVGDSGSGMAYAGAIGGGLAIELDTFAFSDEIPADHLAIQTSFYNEDDEQWELSADYAYTRGGARLRSDINDQQMVVRVEVVGIDYGDEMHIYAIVRNDASGEVLGSGRGEYLSKASFLDGNGCAYIGFTAATGGAFNEHSVLNWSYQGFASSCGGELNFQNFLPQTVTVDEGDFVTLTYQGSATDGPFVYWWRKELGQGESYRLEDNESFFGTSSNELIIGPATPDMAGDYSYGLENGCTGVGTGFTLVVNPSTPACPADLGVQGGTPGQDGILDNNDFVVFIGYFFQHNPLADHGVQGGSAGHDGLFDNNDFVVFIGEFFAGCG